MNRGQVLGGFMVVVIGAAVGASSFLGIGPLGGTPTGDIVQETLQLTTSNDLEVLKVEDEGSLDRVVVRDGDQVSDYFVTDDGKYLVTNLVEIGVFQEQQKARNEFLDCLEASNAKFFGILGNSQQFPQHNQATQLQVQALGGVNGLENIFGGPGNSEPVVNAVRENGVVWQVNGQLQTGVKTTQQLEKLTGCAYNPPQSSSDSDSN